MPLVPHLAQSFLPDVASLLLRVVLGSFFVLARFRWMYDPSRPAAPWFNGARHMHLEKRLCTCGYGLHPVMCDVVAWTEVLAGSAILVGLFTPLALVGILCVLMFATICTAHDKVMAQEPVDKIDCVSCYLWRVEGVYIAIALSLLALGAGRYSLDALLSPVFS